MVRPPSKNNKDIPFYYLTHKFYTKYRKQTHHFVGHSNLKPIGCVAFFNIQEKSAALTSSISYINVVKRGKKLVINPLQLSKNVSLSIRSNIISKVISRSWTLFWCGVHRTSIFSIKKYIELIDKYYGKNVMEEHIRGDWW